jgi:hypothetical protein
MCIADNNKDYNNQGYYYTYIPATCVKRVLGKHITPGSMINWPGKFPMPEGAKDVSRIF